MLLPCRYIGDEPGQGLFHFAGKSAGTGSQRFPENLHMDVFKDNSGTHRGHVSHVQRSHITLIYFPNSVFMSVTDLVNRKVPLLG